MFQLRQLCELDINCMRELSIQVYGSIQISWIDFDLKSTLSVNSTSLTGIMFTNGEFWKVQRRFALHNFRNLGFGKRNHQEHIHDEIDDMIDSLTKRSGPVDIQV